MGSQKSYMGGGNFSQYLYEPVAGTEFEMNGLKCKVIKLTADSTGTHSSIPQFSATSDAYLVLGTDGKPKQMAVYKDHKLDKDFDWTHSHTNKGNGQHFDKGVVHVHPDVSHGTDARYMNNGEINLYGDIIHHYYPDAKLRP